VGAVHVGSWLGRRRLPRGTTSGRSAGGRYEAAAAGASTPVTLCARTRAAGPDPSH